MSGLPMLLRVPRGGSGGTRLPVVVRALRVLDRRTRCSRGRSCRCSAPLDMITLDAVQRRRVRTHRAGHREANRTSGLAVGDARSSGCDGVVDGDDRWPAPVANFSVEVVGVDRAPAAGREALHRRGSTWIARVAPASRSAHSPDALRSANRARPCSNARSTRPPLTGSPFTVTRVASLNARAVASVMAAENSATTGMPTPTCSPLTLFIRTAVLRDVVTWATALERRDGGIAGRRSDARGRCGSWLNADGEAATADGPWRPVDASSSRWTGGRRVTATAAATAAAASGATGALESRRARRGRWSAGAVQLDRRDRASWSPTDALGLRGRRRPRRAGRSGSSGLVRLPPPQRAWQIWPCPTAGRRLDRTLRDPERLGDLALGQAGPVTQDQHLLLAAGQPLDGLRARRGLLLAQHRVLVCGRGIASGSATFEVFPARATRRWRITDRGSGSRRDARR